MLRHSRSRHERHNLDTFDEDQETAAVLDARMVEDDEEEMDRRRIQYVDIDINIHPAVPAQV